MIKKITSIQNPFIKQLVKLQDKSRERKKTGLFIVEGLRELTLALAGDYNIKQLLFVAEIISFQEIARTLPYLEEIETIEITKEVYQKIAYRDSTEGIIGVIETKKHLLSLLDINTKNPLLLIAEAPEKPGNIGAILRTADAANVTAVIIANPKTDLYNPNIIRSSVGGVFTNQIAIGTTLEIISFLKEKNVGIYCAALKEDSQDYNKQDFTKSTAIVVGTEATGLSEEWLKNATQNIIIPMRGQLDSMNVSVSAGILIFEAIRQRQH